MQKLFLLLVIAYLIVTITGCIGTTNDFPDTPVGAEVLVQSDRFFIGNQEVTLERGTDAELITEYGIDIAFPFSVEKATYEYLLGKYSDFNISAKYTEYTEDEENLFNDAIPAVVIERGEEGDNINFLAVVSGILSEDYNTDFITVLEMSFTDEFGEPYVIRTASSVANVHETALMEYTDRSSKRDDYYTHSDGVGGYTPYDDLSIRRTILYTTLHVSAKNGVAADLSLCENYTSPYEISYFDGVLTVAMKNGDDIDTGLLKYIIVNGESTYFAVYEGRIKIVVG